MPEAPVTLEPTGAEHAAAVQALASDPAIGATSNVPSPYPENGAVHWIEQVQKEREEGTRYAFAILDEHGEFVGVCSLLHVDPGAGTGELGYWVGRPYWGRGYATAAGRRVLGFAFGKLGLEWIRAGIDPCGERGEFHTFVSAAPGIRSPVPDRIGEAVLRDARFAFRDLLPDAA